MNDFFWGGTIILGDTFGWEGCRNVTECVRYVIARTPFGVCHIWNQNIKTCLSLFHGSMYKKVAASSSLNQSETRRSYPWPNFIKLTIINMITLFQSCNIFLQPVYNYLIPLKNNGHDLFTFAVSWIVHFSTNCKVENKPVALMYD